VNLARDVCFDVDQSHQSRKARWRKETQLELALDVIACSGSFVSAR
jgi:hypothetical protein